MKIDTGNLQEYLESSVRKGYGKKINSKINLKINNVDIKENCPKVKKRVYKYIREGGPIKLYVFEDGIKKECLKTIPLSEVTPEILAQVENVSFADVLAIIERQKENKKMK